MTIAKTRPLILGFIFFVSGRAFADAPVCATPADATSARAVRGYFAALGRNDFTAAIALTEGAARGRTEQMIGRLRSEARSAGARVEVKVRALEVAERPEFSSAPELAPPVAVSFAIDIIGHKWFFSRVARRLAGSALFFVAPSVSDAAPRIVDIEGQLD